MKIIAFYGKSGSGKDTIAQMAKKHLKDKKIFCFSIAFADSLKEFILDKLPYPFSSLEKIEALKNNKNFFFSFKGNKYTMRELMQYVGQGIKELLGNDIWLKPVQRKLQEFEQQGVQYVFITDVRFEAENQFLEEYNTVRILVKRDAHNEYEHISEEELEISYDYTVSNNGLLEELEEQIVNIIEKMK